MIIVYVQSGKQKIMAIQQVHLNGIQVHCIKCVVCFQNSPEKEASQGFSFHRTCLTITHFFDILFMKLISRTTIYQLVMLRKSGEIPVQFIPAVMEYENRMNHWAIT